jgi:hypothetical protein
MLRTKAADDVFRTGLRIVVQMLWNERSAVRRKHFHLYFSA